MRHGNYAARLDVVYFRVPECCVVSTHRCAVCGTQVHLGEHVSGGSHVAIKAIARERLNRKLTENLESEISILRNFRHPNIVELYDIKVMRHHDRCSDVPVLQCPPASTGFDVPLASVSPLSMLASLHGTLTQWLRVVGVSC